jgi:Tfp pilus assembly protein PilF
VKKGQVKYGAWGVGVNSFALQNYYSESEAGVYYGRRLDRYLAVGAGVKYLSIGYGNDEYTSLNPVFANATTKSNVSADVGVMYFPSEALSLGLSVKDVNGPDMGIKYSDPVAQKILVGGAYHLGRGVFVAGIEGQRDWVHFGLGGERWFIENRFAGRVACNLGTKSFAELSAGASYKAGRIRVDYALNYPLSGISGTYGTHVMTFGYAFWNPVTTRSVTAEEKSAEEKKRQEEASAAYTQALQALGKHEYASATELMKKAVELDPGNEKYKALDGRLAAVQPYVAGIMKSRKTGSDSARKALAVYTANDEGKNAIDLLVYAYSLNTGNDSAQEMAKAIARKEKLEIPDSTPGWNYAQQKLSVALERFKEKKYYECIKLCEDSLYLEPRNPVAYKRMGSAFFMLKNKAKAREAWQNAVQYAPNQEDAQKTQQMIRELDNSGDSGREKQP